MSIKIDFLIMIILPCNYSHKYQTFFSRYSANQSVTMNRIHKQLLKMTKYLVMLIKYLKDITSLKLGNYHLRLIIIIKFFFQYAFRHWKNFRGRTLVSAKTFVFAVSDRMRWKCGILSKRSVLAHSSATLFNYVHPRGRLRQIASFQERDDERLYCRVTV